MPNKTTRQLRLVTTVSAKEKKQAENLARAEGCKDVGELVRQLLASRHSDRRKKAAKKKAAQANKKKSALSTTSRKLPLGKASLSSKPSRSVGPRNGSTKGSTRRSSKNSGKSGVVVPTSKSRSTTRRSTKSRTSSNR